MTETVEQSRERKAYNDEPWAYAILCKKGEECDHLVFAMRDDAYHELDSRRDMLEEGEPEPELFPLFPARPSLQARLDRAEAVCEAACYLKEQIDRGGYVEAARPQHSAQLWLALSDYLAGKKQETDDGEKTTEREKPCSDKL